MTPIPERFWKCATAASLGLCFLLAARPAGGTKLEADTLRARQFVLIDEQDRPVGTWGPDPANPRALSFCLSDPAAKDGTASIRLAAVDGGVELALGGNPASGSALLRTSERRATLSLSGTCTDASHGLPHRVELATMEARGMVGGLSVLQAYARTVEGRHVEHKETLLGMPPGPGPSFDGPR